MVSAEIDLSSAYPRQPLTPSQNEIIGRLPELFLKAQSKPLLSLTEEFIELFFSLSGQATLSNHHSTLLSYSASAAIKIVGAYFRHTGKSVALLEPTLPNISDLLEEEGVTLHSFPEEWLLDSTLPECLDALNTDVIWIVLPNNPTGRWLTSSAFRRLVDYCSVRGKLLVCDACFRLFCQAMINWDQYKILHESGISFAIIEDTGKTWPTLDTKVGILTCSTDLFPPIQRMNYHLLNNISPFQLAVLSEFVKDSISEGLDKTVRSYIERNRQILRNRIADTIVKPVSNEAITIPVEWLCVKSSISVMRFVEALSNAGVHVLAGSHFYWSNPEIACPNLRIALARDAVSVARAAEIIARTAGSFGSDLETGKRI